ncbi:MAG TPA: SPOR domain-containing protein [Bryobacteraceae bacterium]|nr:SPOR domain-containing protein [Bryobacteraceae bacterium]HXR76713.1 SPOR domain-containing protein [Bryobacteraceae bacterium]
MLRSSESETEILLGNKQLLGIFFLVAVLIGVAFGGGYMLGRGAGDKGEKKLETATVPAKDPASGGTANPPGGETRTVSPSDSAITDANAATADQMDQPLGSPKHKPAQAGQAEEAAPTATPVSFTPQSGQEFLQVAAVPRGEASGISEVLRKKGFPAHTVPVPGNTKLYRVIVGPIRDVGDLSSTREQLRKTGFGKVIVQKY